MIRYPEDVAKLKAEIPILRNRTDEEVQTMYSEWSELFWSAGWLSLDYGLEGFKEKLTERVGALDDPELDATDFAHPAWWRGADYAADQVAKGLRATIEGKDSGDGVSSSPDIEFIRRWILERR